MKKHALAAVYVGPNKPLEIREYPVTPPGRGMAALSLVASGICGTDLHILEGRLPTEPEKIIGHEFVGRVEAVGEGVEHVRAGDYVIADIACPCGECLRCRQGDDANCLHMGVTNGGDPAAAPHFWGGYAEMSYVPAKNLIRIPDGLDPLAVAVYACAGPTSLHSFRLGREAGWEEKTTGLAVVQGTGPLGAFSVLYLKALGVPTVIALTARKNPERERRIQALGADEVWTLESLSDDEIRRRTYELSQGAGADLVCEASGGAAALPLGLTLLRNRGVYLIPGQYSDRGNVPLPAHRITFGALRLIGSSQYSVSDVEDYLAFLQSHPGLLPRVRELAAAYPVREVNRAFEDLRAGKVMKALLVPEQAR